MAGHQLNWTQLLNGSRRKDKVRVAADGNKAAQSTKIEFRTEFERDYDRILFSTPVRRLADKTQVFPLERNDGVRTRLTHSHEVSNLARSIGTHLVFDKKLAEENGVQVTRNIPALLAAIGLAHDLGNPPFGHQGEAAIQRWMAKNSSRIFDDKSDLTKAMKQDFLRFEGNAQTLRLLTRLQLLNDDFGLNLTYGTLAALLKYPVDSDKVEEKGSASRKKHGFFQSEKSIVEEVWSETGLAEGIRHPLTYVMEACDDIAYSMLDAEDASKKGLVSYFDLVAFLKHGNKKDPDSVISNVLALAEKDHAEYSDQGLSPTELNDISIQKFRVYAITHMVQAVTESFAENLELLLAGSFTSDLIAASRAKLLVKRLKSFAYTNAYKHRTVLEVELTGANTIHGLMDLLWYAIQTRDDASTIGSKRSDPFANYVYSRISENYRRVCEASGNPMPIRYRELQLLTDMVSGMTDSFAMSLYEELRAYDARQRG